MRDSERSDLALLLLMAARVLVCVFGVGVLVRLFPLQVLEPAWQISFCSTLLNQAALPLVALVFVHAASALLPADGPLATIRARWRRLAVAAALGFLLLLPLQAFATWRGLAVGSQQDAARRLAAERRSAALQQAITAATGVDDLQARLQRLQGPTLTPADRALPLPQLRRQLEASLLAARNQLLDRFAGPAPVQVWTILRDGLRLAVTALAYGFAFAAGGQRRQSDLPLLVEWSLALRGGPQLGPRRLGWRPTGSAEEDSERYLREIESREP